MGRGGPWGPPRSLARRLLRLMRVWRRLPPPAWVLAGAGMAMGLGLFALALAAIRVLTGG